MKFTTAIDEFVTDWKADSRIRSAHTAAGRWGAPCLRRCRAAVQRPDPRAALANMLDLEAA